MKTQEQKHAIKHRLEDYVNHIGSQNKVANSWEGVSAATLSQIRNDNWELINDSMWLKIEKYLGISSKSWNFSETSVSQKLTHVYRDSKEHSLVMAVCGSAGTGKTGTTEEHVKNNKNVFHLHCNEYWDRRWFLKELLKTMGTDPNGMVMAEMMEEVVVRLKGMDKPQIILDEADKLRDQVFYFFITLYNRLEDQCSIVLIATAYLKKRINRGLSLNKKGYREIHSRIGKRFIELGSITLKDVILICSANGITDKNQIKEIYEDCDQDIRRVKRLVHAYKMKAKTAA
jgi:hypothetical protein